MPQISLHTIIGATCLLGSLLFGPTIAMAEYSVNEALAAYDSANPDDRKTWELIFGNTQNGINWANSVLVYSYCVTKGLPRARRVIGAAQHGHRDRVLTRATNNRLRIVATEFGM